MKVVLGINTRGDIYVKLQQLQDLTLKLIPEIKLESFNDNKLHKIFHYIQAVQSMSD